MTPRTPRRGALETAANGHLSYVLACETPRFLKLALAHLETEHGFALVTEPVVGFDEIIAQVERNGVQLYVAWDIWTGFDVLALTDQGDDLVRSLSSSLDGLAASPLGREALDAS